VVWKLPGPGSARIMADVRRQRALGAAVGVLCALIVAVVWLQYGRHSEAAKPRPRPQQASLRLAIKAPNGGPAAGARVRVVQGDAARDAQADRQGEAHLDGLGLGETHVVMTWPGAGGHALVVKLVAGDNAVRVLLEPAVVLSGKIEDETGAAIAGAELQLAAEGDGALVFDAQSDDQGGFRFTDLRAGSYALQARADLHELAVVPSQIAPASDVHVVLQRTSALRGEVLEVGGKPAIDAAVTIAGSGVWPPKTVRTGKDGRFELTPVPGGVYELRATRATFTSAPQEGVNVAPASAAFVRLQLEPGASVRGRVFDAEKGEALRGVAVTIGEDALSSVPSEAKTDAEGRFAIEGLRHLPHRLWIHAPTYVAINGEPIVPRDEDYAFPLRRAATLAGIVVDEDARPIADAELEVTGTTDTGARVQVSPLIEPSVSPNRPAVSLVAPSGDNLGVTSGTVPKIPVLALPGSGDQASAAPGFRSDATGRFQIEGVPPGRVQLVARKQGFALGRSELRDVKSGDQVAELHVVLSRGGTLLGRVLDAQGLPVPAVRIQVEIAGEPSARVTLSGDDGRFEVAAVRGTCTVTASAMNGVSVREQLEVGSGERRELVLELGGEAHSLNGRVLDSRGFPIAGALVKVEAESARTPVERSTTSGPDGTFRASGLPAPPYRVRVEHADYAPAMVRAVSLEAPKELSVTLRAGVRVVGLVLDGMTNDGIAGARVRLKPAGGREALTARADAQGKFELRNILPGNYEVFSDHDQHVPARTKVLVSEVEQRELDPIVLQPAGAVSGDVVDRLGAPVFNAEVSTGSPAAFARTDHAGHFRITGVVPGDQQVSARHTQAGATSVPVPVRVYPRQESPGLVLRLPGQCSL
jgi:hypothetical protein